MVAYRKRHRSLGRSRFWRDDIHWYGVGPEVDLSYDSHTLSFCLHGASQQDIDIYVMINAYWQALEFTIQEAQAQDWRRIVDTSLPSPADFVEPGQELVLQDLNYSVKTRSVVILERH